ncbi:unnamed protein product [Knipowitschia caucasica]
MKCSAEGHNGTGSSGRQQKWSMLEDKSPPMMLCGRKAEADSISLLKCGAGVQGWESRCLGRQQGVCWGPLEPPGPPRSDGGARDHS